jgi:predicted alpha/beta hydrolase
VIEMTEYFVEPEEGIQLWLGRMGDPTGQAILLIHGAIENGRIFYTEKGKGLAPYLAQKGYDVFITDLRGKGKSLPAADSGKLRGGQFEVIVKDLPAIINKINELKGEETSIHLMAHSWGGVLIASWYARFGREHTNIRSITFFACKRKIYVHHPKRWFMVDLMWTGIGSIATKWKGYLPAKKLGIGADNEPGEFFFQCNKWVYSNKWIDPVDGFDYKIAFPQVKFPPVLSLTGVADHSLGNTYCVNRMLKEISPVDCTHLDLGIKNGNKNNYGHVNILTHPDCSTDHFPLVVNWLAQFK